MHATTPALPSGGRTPNVLWIVADQFRFDCLRCAGHPVVRTPNLDALADRGVRFASAYAPTAPCGPARASIFTGRYPDTHGLGAHGGDHLDPPERPVLTERLREAGHHTALIGKLHLKPLARDFGFGHLQRAESPYHMYDPAEPSDSAYVRWLVHQTGAESVASACRPFEADEECFASDERRFLMGRAVVPEALHNTAWTANEAAAFLRAGPAEPFFLNVSFFGPHQPYLCPGRWGRMYDPDDVPLPAGWDHETADKPIFGHFPFLADQPSRREGWSERAVREILAAYYGNVSMIDHYLGRLFDALDDRRLWDDTLVVFTADHGDYAGQFRCFYKSLAYEGSAHVPLIAAGAGVRPGRVESAAVSTIDLHATFLATAGLGPDAGCESRDLSALLAGNPADWPDEAFFKQGTQSALMGWGGHKLMRGDLPDGRVAYEFYDLAREPMDAVNRMDDPAHAETVKAMRARLDAWHEAQAAAGRDATRETCQ